MVAEPLAVLRERERDDRAPAKGLQDLERLCLLVVLAAAVIFLIVKTVFF